MLSTTIQKKKKPSGSPISHFFTAAVLLCAAGYAVFSSCSSGLASDAAVLSAINVREGVRDFERSPVPVCKIEDTGELRLINGGHSFESAEAVTVSAFGRIALSRSNIELTSAALDAADRLFEAAAADGFDDLVLTSGYRSYEQQSGLYERAEDKSFVQKPGFSEHQTGLALDMQLLRGGINELGGTRQGRWLAENAWKYGFVLRYPNGKTDITGIGYEPWHFRYTGFPHAAAMIHEQLCLEEYIDLLADCGGLTVAAQGRSFQIYRTLPEDGCIPVPNGTEYTVSSDNCGGYIVTFEIE